ncbi:MAG TPA: cyclopropane-fatty-acyl-phospholipid synthase family protein [Stenotrophobium sp.]|nr:cyclopropane-fatty-acyl-phospholipid synthase family protein [Stenotrophobium sp.]
MKLEQREQAGRERDLIPRDGFSPELPAMLKKKSGGMTWGLHLLMFMLKGIKIGQLDVTLPNGETRQFRGTSRPELRGILNIRDGRIMRHVLKNGEVGFGEAYLEGLWDSPDLSSLLIVLYLNEPHYLGPYEKNFVARFLGWLKHKRRANTKTKAVENIQYHYDLGNEFYKMWLDNTMAYSSGVFSREESMSAPSGMSIKPNETLMDAQVNKFKLMYERLGLKPEHTLLEIGSGWGGFAIYAAQHSGCRVHSITLSKEQLEEARRRAEAAGVGDRVTFELRDYRDVAGQYDRVVSIEMYEAVGEEFWPEYFAAIQRALKPGGRAAIQGITIHPEIFDNYRSKIDFIQKYIFPGGMLATPGVFMDVATRAGLMAEGARFFAQDYADTLAIWHRNVLAVRDSVVRQFDERFLRMWRYYLAYCECGFRVERVNLMQITLLKA